MSHTGGIASPTWRALFVFATWVTATFGAAPAGPPPELSQASKPNPAEAARLLEQFRQAGIPGQFYLEFDLRSLPRRGEERTYKGRMWGGRNAQGALTRVELTDAEGTSHRLLLQNGERPAVWRFSGGRVAPLDVASLFLPLIPGVEVTAFDVQMPFLYWPDAALEKITRVNGRPTHAFLFKAPAAFLAQHREITIARAYLDAQFNQLMQTDLISRENKVVKTFSFVSLKRIGEHYIPKQADYRNDITRDKTRLQVTAAALNQKFPASIFEAASLAQPAQPPAAGHIVRIDP